MKKNIKNIGVIILAVIVSLNFSGCEATKNASNTQKGGAIGAAGGAILSPLIIMFLKDILSF